MLNPKTPSERQDTAAGGRHARELRVEGGRTYTASIETVKIANHFWAYLRFKNGNQTTRKYIGRVTAPTKDECLRLGWKLVRELKVVEIHGWEWVSK